MADAITVSGPISGTDKTLTFETGRLAFQSQGAVVASLAGTRALVTSNAAKGIREGRIVFKHAFRNVMVPVVTVTALQFGTLLAGAVITETVFSLPGLGQLLLRAVLSRDYALIRGCVLLTAMTFAVINLAVDLSYGWIDPRIRFS